MASSRVHQLRIDAHAVVGFADTALQHIAHPEVPADLGDLHRLAFVDKGRVTSDDQQARELGERGNEVIGHPVTEILLLQVATHIGKRQHGNGGLVGQRKLRFLSNEC